ncbi:F-box/WD repeat-containing protein 9 [Thalassophryne amazonica]|uniref:F-box/WD repeat-containing protein 9 n=1 Tax=Thalassophryne amazonica TaxID=390379 RepID=UPI0014720CFB|nr:F-box/WD repeat-containing protein 9 [Thalassophryne amazonica]
MCEVKGQLEVQPDGGQEEHQDKPSVKTECNSYSRPELQGLVLRGQMSVDDVPSPAAESGLLSLPWEMIVLIASHLPAQCVISVLPKVCRALGNVAKDSTAWQLRARKLTGSQAGFPVGLSTDFDWIKACLEMEQLILCWGGQKHLSATRSQDDDREVERVIQQQRAGLEREPVAEGQEDDGDRRHDEEREDLAELKVPYAIEEEMEMALAEPRHLDNDNDMELERHQLCSPAPSTSSALECITIQSDHIAQVNSVLLVGDAGTVCATGSRDWNVKLWDLQEGSGGSLLQTLGAQGNFSTHRGWVWCLASRGPLLASGGFDSTVRLWDLDSGGAERGLIRTGAAVLCLSYQTDVLLAGTFDRRVRIYDIRAAEPLVKTLHLHGNAVMCLAEDDKYIISGSKDCTVAMYDRRAGKSLKQLQLNSYLLSMSYSDSEFWAGDCKGMIHSFSMEAGMFKHVSQFDVGHTALITGIYKSPGSLYTCSTDCTVKIHIPCAPPRTLCTLRHQSTVLRLNVQDGVLAVASGDVGCVKVWRPAK